MKITFNENGTVVINGRGITVITPKTEVEFIIKNNVFNPDVFEIEGIDPSKVTVTGFTFQHSKTGVIVTPE